MDLRFKKVLFVCIVMAVLITMMPSSAFAAVDISDHWAKQQINDWTSKELVKGYADNTFKPDNNITRAEFFALINKVFGCQEKAEINFSDVSRKAWYNEEIAKAVAAGYAAGYPDGTIKPQSYITRQEAAAVVAGAFGLGSNKAFSGAEFKDAGQIKNWAQSFVSVMKDKGLINGYPDGTFRPENNIKRAEAIIILDNAGGDILNKPGTYSEEAKRNLVVNVGDVILKDMTISGDLYLAEGIGDGEVTLDGVIVKGKTLVRGGGENSVILRNTTLGDVEVNKPKGSGQPVRLVSEGNTSVSGTVTLNSGTKLEEINVSQGATGFNNVIVSDKLPETAKVLFSGEFKEVTLMAKEGVIEISGNATVSTITVQAAAKVVIAEGAKVSAVTVTETAQGANIEAKAQVKVQVKAENVTVNNTTITTGSTANISSGGTTTITGPTGIGSSGGGGGSDDNSSAAGISVTLLIPDDGIIPFHFDAIVKNTQTNTPITGLVVGNFSLKKGQTNIPLNSEAFHELLSEDPQYNVPGRYTIYPADEYRPMAGEYTLAFAKSGYVTTTAAFEVKEWVSPVYQSVGGAIGVNSGTPDYFADSSVQLKKDGVDAGLAIAANADGTFNFEQVAAGTGYTIVVNVTGYDEGVIGPFEVVEGTDITDADITLQKTVTIPVWIDGGATDGLITLNPTGADNITYGPESGIHTINGNLVIEGDSAGEITIQSITISGDLTVNTPNATVNVTASVTVTGTTNIQAVSPDTFNSEGSHNGVIEVAGTASLNLSGNASQAPVQVSTTSPVKLKGSINLVRILSEDAVVNIDSGTVNYLQIEVNNVDVNNIGGTLANILVKDTVEVQPVTTGIVPPVVQLMSGFKNISLIVGGPLDNSNSIVLDEGETLAASSSVTGAATVTVGGAGGNELQVTPVSAGKSAIDVQVKNDNNQVIKAGNFYVKVAPAAPDSGDVAVVQPAPNEAVGQTKINIANSLEFRIMNADDSLVKQNWRPGTDTAKITQASIPLIAGDKIEVRVKAAALKPASDKFTYTLQQGDIGAADKTVLTSVIATAQGKVSGAVVGTDPRNPGEVLQTDVDALVTAVAAAQAIADDAGATVKQVSDAVTALNAALAAFNASVQGGVEEPVSIQEAEVTITTGSAVFNYAFIGSDLSSITYDEALADPYKLNLAASTVRLEMRNGENVTHATYDIPFDQLNITAGSVSYADLDAVESAFGNSDFMNVWQGPPTHIVLVLQGGLAGDAWEMDPITIQFKQSDLDAFAGIMPSPGDGGGTPGPFTPGDGGSLPVFPVFNEEPGKIGGLYISRSYRENNPIGGGTRPVVDFAFRPPQKYGADGFTLQYSADNGTTWQNYQYDGADLTTSSNTQDNFSFTPAGSYKYRLLVNGGKGDGCVSNEADAPLSDVPTTFAGWSLDESMFLTGIMTPYIGSGKEASFTVTSLSDGSEVQGYLAYQWYRVNPMSFEMIPVPGATGLTYTTTSDDAGYYLLCRAEGDGVNVGGFAQIITFYAPEISNKTYVTDVTQTGFRVNLSKSVSGLTPGDLELYYLNESYQSVYISVTSVTHVENNAVFDVSAAIPPGITSIILENTSPFWRIVSDIGEQHMMTPGVEISVPEFIDPGPM